jgi:hypothetical protein
MVAVPGNGNHNTRNLRPKSLAIETNFLRNVVSFFCICQEGYILYKTQGRVHNDTKVTRIVFITNAMENTL